MGLRPHGNAPADERASFWKELRNKNFAMKNLIIAGVAVASLLTLSACSTDNQPQAYPPGTVIKSNMEPPSSVPFPDTPATTTEPTPIPNPPGAGSYPETPAH
jgi:predicted small lipoprotein YifL